MRRHNYSQMLLFAALCGITTINLTPTIWAFMTSIKLPVDAFAVPPKFVFARTFDFHRQVWIEKDFLRLLKNSAIITAANVCISVPIGTMAAFGVSSMQCVGARNLLFGLLAMRMFPHILLAIPFFVIATFVDLIDTYAVMVLALVAINQPFTIWLMRSFFLDVPTELDEAACIDGCNLWQSFHLIALPIVRPGLWVTALFSILLAYNEFLFALVLTGPET